MVSFIDIIVRIKHYTSTQYLLEVVCVRSGVRHVCMKNEKCIMRTLPLNRDVPIRYFLTAVTTQRGRESFVAPKWVCKSRVRFSDDGN